MIRIALPTGRSLDDCVEVLRGSGLPTEKLENAGRLLIIDDGPCRYMLVKPADIPTLVSQGAADLALVGSDVTGESGAALSELADTGRGRCFLAVAGAPELASRFDGHSTELMGLRVATKYTRTATRTFALWGAQIRLLKLSGSIELAPALGLSDCIFDIVQTGGTLKANGLVVIRRAADVSLRLVANDSALQLRWDALRDTVRAIQKFSASN